jgi:hypothetical protein
LLFDDQLKGSGAHKECGRGSGRVVEDRSDINVLDLIEWVNGLDSIRVKLVEDEADPSTTREFDAGQLLIAALQDRSIFVAEFRDDIEYYVSAVAEKRIAEAVEFCLVFLKRRLDASLDIGQSLLDVHHEDL